MYHALEKLCIYICKYLNLPNIPINHAFADTPLHTAAEVQNNCYYCNASIVLGGISRANFAVLERVRTYSAMIYFLSSFIDHVSILLLIIVDFIFHK